MNSALILFITLPVPVEPFFSFFLNPLKSTHPSVCSCHDWTQWPPSSAWFCAGACPQKHVTARFVSGRDMIVCDQDGRGGRLLSSVSRFRDYGILSCFPPPPPSSLVTCS